MQPEHTTTVAIDRLTALAQRIFVAVGSPPTEAATVAEELVLADRMGMHSHGCTRVGDYVEAVRDGRVVPGGAMTIAQEADGTALIDGGSNFGQVVGRFALGVAVAKARAVGTATVVTRRCFHLGRVGALMERAAAQDLLAIATVAVGLPGKVAPWGAAEGVLGTNPFAYGVPFDGGEVVTDFATSASAEGVVDLANRSGERMPDGILIDADGDPTNDPGTLFSATPGALLPFGGSQATRAMRSTSSPS